MAPEGPSTFTTIGFHNGEEDYDNTSMELTAPLLHHGDAEIPMGNNDEEEDKSERKSFHKLICLGILIGFLIQVVSFGSFAIILVQWGDKVVQRKSDGDWFLLIVHAILSFLTQIDICAHVVLWMAFACAMIMGRMAMRHDQIQTPVRRIFAFAASGVLYFLIGILLGAFLAFSMFVLVSPFYFC
jgi:hypothetical protein